MFFLITALFLLTIYINQPYRLQVVPIYKRPKHICSTLKQLWWTHTKLRSYWRKNLIWNMTHLMFKRRENTQYVHYFGLSITSDSFTMWQYYKNNVLGFSFPPSRTWKTKRIANERMTCHKTKPTVSSCSCESIPFSSKSIITTSLLFKQ